jgi:hypothetical protein
MFENSLKSSVIEIWVQEIGVSCIILSKLIKRNYELTVANLWRRFIFPDYNYSTKPVP